MLRRNEDKLLETGRAWLSEPHEHTDFYSYSISRLDYGPKNPNTGDVVLELEVQIAGERMQFWLERQDSVSLLSVRRFVESVPAILDSFNEHAGHTEGDEDG